MATSSIGKKVLKLGYIGAGGINFGTPEGPWNHAAKLEKFPGEVMPSVTGKENGLAGAMVSASDELILEAVSTT